MVRGTAVRACFFILSPVNIVFHYSDGIRIGLMSVLAWQGGLREKKNPGRGGGAREPAARRGSVICRQERRRLCRPLAI